MTKKYIHLDFTDACDLKWAHGAKEHRKKPGDGFTGDPVEELFQEFLDGVNLVSEIERRGGELPGFRTTLRNMGLTLQEMRRRGQL